MPAWAVYAVTAVVTIATVTASAIYIVAIVLATRSQPPEGASGPVLDEYGYQPVDGIESLDELAERARENALAEDERNGDAAADEARIDRWAA